MVSYLAFGRRSYTVKLWKKIALYLASIVSCLVICVGYASLTDTLSVTGNANVTPRLPDVHITSITPESSAGVTVNNTYGTILFAGVTGGGTATFTVDVTNISHKLYYFERVVDGAETGIDGVYSGTDITYELQGLTPRDELASNTSLSFTLTVSVPEGVTTDSYILYFKFISEDKLDEALFPEEMPKEEVDVVQRLSDILNGKYQTDTVTDSLYYLINEVIQVRWSPGAPPYVGSMDKNYKEKLDNLFGDVLTDTSVSFILKNQDLNWDGYNEIALYSTSDPLDSTNEWAGDGVVCVYITVFTPVLDSQKNVIGYTMVCEALRGFCGEVRYGENDLTPSFSTDHWRDDIGHWYWDEATNQSYIVPIPEDAMSHDGTKPYRNDYDSYNRYYQQTWWGTAPYGKTQSECLSGKIPWLG